MVNEKIRENIPVVTRIMKKDEALELGAMALFGEKYGDNVRVVVIDPNFSVELCGGTHVMHTGMIGLFNIQSESAVAAGVRRIEALTGPRSFNFFTSQLEKVKELGTILKAADPVKAIEKLIQEKADLEKKVEHLENRMLVGIRNELMHKDEIIDGVTFVGDIVNVSNPDALKKLCFDLKNNLHDYVAVIGANIGGKALCRHWDCGYSCGRQEPGCRKNHQGNCGATDQGRRGRAKKPGYCRRAGRESTSAGY